MKINITRILVLLAVAVLLYPSCKKDQAAVNNQTTLDYKAMSGQIAMSLYRGITGQYGGTDVSKGIVLPANVNVANHAGLRLNSTSTLCGFGVDTTFSSSRLAGDTTSTLFGDFHFVYNCSASTPDGYTVHDSLTTTQSGKSFSYKYTVAQNYVVKALDQTYRVVSMNGSIYTFVYSRAGAYYELSSAYKLHNLVVNFSSGTADITSGVSSFTMFGYQQSANPLDDGHPVQYAGTIVYSGNHLARLTITANPGVTYLVNLQTGLVTRQ